MNYVEQIRQEEKELLIVKVIEWAQKQKRQLCTLSEKEIVEIIGEKAFRQTF